jgi:DNA primase
MLGATPVGDLNIPFWVGTQVHGQVIRRLEGRQPKYVAPKAEDFPLGRRPILIVGNPKPQPYLLVEGYLDQPASEVLGIPAIGTGAAILSKEQVQDLRTLGEQGATFYIQPDDEESGESAVLKNTRRLYPYGYMLPPIAIDGVKDVSDLYARDPDNAAEILKGLMAQGRDALELALEELPEGGRAKVRFIKDSVVPLLPLLPSEAERLAVIKDGAKRANLTQEIVARAVAEAQPMSEATAEAPQR